MNTDSPPDIPDSLLDRLSHARNVFVMTGAGMSAESGIPTFRDAQTGLWKNYRPEDLATPQAFDKNPKTVWSWYEERRTKISKASPHAGHHALVELESHVPQLQISTQNVDGLHQRAGSTRVIELHGNILRSVCHVTGKTINDELIARSNDAPPRSPYARNGMARPDVVWFGEFLPESAINDSVAAAASCDFCFSIGTTSLVQPAASLPLIALEHGACLVEVNPNPTALSLHASYCLRGPASRVLNEIVNRLMDTDHNFSSSPRL